MTAVRDASTLILLRDGASGPAVLMGQRGARAAFMPGKFVFPGGAVDTVDADVPIPDLAPDVALSLSAESAVPPTALAAAAVRELWEETGLCLGTPGHWPGDPPRGWRSFAATGLRPAGGALRYFFRAVTPPGRTRRFDARFFLARAEALASDPDDFSRAEDELAHLQWVPLARARDFDLPFITQVVLAELGAHLAAPDAPLTIPFFRNDDERQLVTRLGGPAPL